MPNILFQDSYLCGSRFRKSLQYLYRLGHVLTSGEKSIRTSSGTIGFSITIDIRSSSSCIENGLKMHPENPRFNRGLLSSSSLAVIATMGIVLELPIFDLRNSSINANPLVPGIFMSVSIKSKSRLRIAFTTSEAVAHTAQETALRSSISLTISRCSGSSSITITLCGRRKILRLALLPGYRPSLYFR